MKTKKPQGNGKKDLKKRFLFIEIMSRLSNGLGTASLFIGLYLLGVGFKIFEYSPRFSNVITSTSDALFFGIILTIISFGLNPKILDKIKSLPR